MVARVRATRSPDPRLESLLTAASLGTDGPADVPDRVISRLEQLLAIAGPQSGDCPPLGPRLPSAGSDSPTPAGCMDNAAGNRCVAGSSSGACCCWRRINLCRPRRHSSKPSSTTPSNLQRAACLNLCFHPPFAGPACGRDRAAATGDRVGPAAEPTTPPGAIARPGDGHRFCPGWLVGRGRQRRTEMPADDQAGSIPWDRSYLRFCPPPARSVLT